MSADALGMLGDDTLKSYMGGAEAAWFAQQGTVHGRAGFGLAEWDGFSADHMMGAVGGRYYVKDNIRFDAEGSFNRISYETADLDLQSLLISGNYRPERMPVTFFAGYRFDHIKLSDVGISGSDNINTVFGGLRMSFGSKSLKDEERSGPVWSASTLLP